VHKTAQAFPGPLLRILWVKAGKLLPVDTGGKIRSYNILRQLSRAHDVTLLSYYGGRMDSEYQAQISREFAGAKTVHTNAMDGSAFAQVVDYMRQVFRPAPFAVSKFTDPEVRRLLAFWLGQKATAGPADRNKITQEKLSKKDFDVAVCDFLSASMNFPEKSATPVVLFQHNVETALWQRLASTEPNWAKRIAYRIEARKMGTYERAAAGMFRHVIAVSELDKQQMLAMNPSCEISVVPTGVDIEKFPVAPPALANPPRIVFLGSMDWEPNIDAVTYFSREIFPRIRAQIDSAIFQIVGRNPSPGVQHLASESIEVTGTVHSVAGYLQNATLIVVPLRIGGGTRLKIFEAMATGRAIVSTSIGAEGLPVKNGRDIILADDPQAFSNAVIQLLSDSALRRRYELAAAQLAAQYDWSNIGQQFAAVLEKVCLPKSPSKPT
jgi:polysaccharide biosynthesis protein PslH